jgi:hypothetical protein
VDAEIGVDPNKQEARQKWVQEKIKNFHRSSITA